MPPDPARRARDAENAPPRRVCALGGWLQVGIRGWGAFRKQGPPEGRKRLKDTPVPGVPAVLAGSAGLAVFAASATLALYLSVRPPLLGDMPFSRAYTDRHGALMRLTLAEDEKYRLFTPLEEISPDLINATLLQEDRHFYRHPGVNPFALARGFYESYLRRSRPVGGSTITMQVVRLRDGLDTRGAGGKIVQMLRALQLEAHYSKRDILEAYLNMAPYGGNIHGAGAASLIYFGVRPAALTAPQSYLLAVVPQNPARRSPLNPDRRALDEARIRLLRLASGRLAGAGSDMAALSALRLPVRKREDLPFLAPHTVDSLEAGEMTTVGAAETPFVSTTIDLPLQRMLEREITAHLKSQSRKGSLNAAAMIVNFETMDVLALSGSADFFDIAAQGQIDGTQARRSPGSALKPFVYALALEQGLIHAETLLSDDPAYFAEYRPGNFDKRFIGQIPAREALTLSRNVPAIALAARLQNPGLYEFLQQAGAGFPRKPAHYGLSIVVGGAEIDMRTLVTLYAMLANGGVLHGLKTRMDAPATAGTGAGATTEENNGGPTASSDAPALSSPSPSSPALSSPSPASPVLLSPESALTTVAMLEGRKPSDLPFALGSGTRTPLYWKTGTSNGFRDAWTIGIAGPYVIAVWLGNFDGRANPSLVGLDMAAPLFFRIADRLASTKEMADRIHPALARRNVSFIDICPATGLPGICAHPRKGMFIPGKSPFTAPAAQRGGISILSPRSGIDYACTPPALPRIPLQANRETPLHWFADKKYIGKTSGKTPLFWDAPCGKHFIQAIDPAGKSSSVSVNVVVSD